MEAGELLKSLRKERQLTQEELAENITTRPTLASIENRNNTISFDVLVSLLNRLNVRMEEFLFLLNDGHHSTKQSLYLKVYSDYYSKGFLSKDIETTLLETYEQTADFFYLALYTQMLGIQLRKQKKLPLNEEKQLSKNVNLVKEHLNTVMNWTHMELALFTNCLFLFEDSYIQAVYKRIVKKILFRKKLRLYQEDILVFFLNCIDLFLERNQNQLVDYFLNELDEQLTRKNQLYEKTLCRFYRAILDIRTGQPQAIEEIKQILEYLKFLGEKKQVQTLVEDVKKYADISL